jgi:hypothetical protein
MIHCSTKAGFVSCQELLVGFCFFFVYTECPVILSVLKDLIRGDAPIHKWVRFSTVVELWFEQTCNSFTMVQWDTAPFQQRRGEPEWAVPDWWSGRDNPQNWPAWSPDLTVLISVYGVTWEHWCMNAKQTEERNYLIEFSMPTDAWAVVMFLCRFELSWISNIHGSLTVDNRVRVHMTFLTEDVKNKIPLLT